MKSKKLFTFIFLLVAMFFSAASVYANDPPVTGGGNQPNVIKLENPFRVEGDLIVFIKTLINEVVLPLGGMLAVLAFIYSGFLYVTAQGNNEKIKTAHKAFLYSAIGTAILLGSWAIANAIDATIKQL